MKLIHLTRVGGGKVSLNPDNIVMLELKSWTGDRPEGAEDWPDQWTDVHTIGDIVQVQELANDPAFMGGNPTRNPKLLKLAADLVNVTGDELGDMLTDGIVTGWMDDAAGHLATQIRSLAGYALGELPDDAKPEPVAVREPPRKSQARKPGRLA